MSLDPMPSARELRAMMARKGLGLPPTGPATPSNPATPTLRPWHPYRSKWEHEYAQRLDALQYAGIVLAWNYEPRSFVIGVGAKYTPDFCVMFADDRREWHEVKGYRREASIVRLKAAALAYPAERFVIVTKIKGQWKLTPISPPPEAR